MDAPRKTENTIPNKNPPDSKLTKQYLNSQAKENGGEKSEKESLPNRSAQNLNINVSQ